MPDFITDEQCEQVYIEYFNDWLSLQMMALHYGINIPILEAIIKHGRDINHGK